MKVSQKVVSGVALILDAIAGPNWDKDPNFKDTPERVAKLYAEMLTPGTNTWAEFPATYGDMVILRGHRVVGLCPHHLLPVVMTAYVGYIPNKQVVGLSKLARVVEEQLTKPIMQEELTHAVAEALQTHLDAKAVGVVITGRHGCMNLRGVHTDGDVVTSCMKGQFLLNPSARDEFFRIIGRP
jgi:GTP cyclohydrolase I